MSTSITVAMVNNFNASVRMLAQQTVSKFRNAVTVEDPEPGEIQFFDQIGPTAAIRRVARHADTPLVMQDHSRRALTMFDWEWADLIDKQDRLRLLLEPDSVYAKNAVAALNRSLDDEIIDAMTRTAYSGKSGTTAVTLPATMQVGSDAKETDNTGGTAANLTLLKLRRAKYLLDIQDNLEEEERWIAVTPSQIQNLLLSTKVGSNEYNEVKALVDGKVNRFMGFNFLVSNRLQKSGNIRTCLAWMKSGVGLKMPQDIMTRVSERADKSYATQVYACMTAGATRLEETKVVSIACDESVMTTAD